MLENWCWQPSVLARLSKHHESGARLPGRLVESMIRSKNVHESLFMLRQIYLGSLVRTASFYSSPPAQPTAAPCDSAVLLPLISAGSCHPWRNPS